jgi:hypothetical protein
MAGADRKIFHGKRPPIHVHRAFDGIFGTILLGVGDNPNNGVAVLAKGAVPVERRRGLPGDPDDLHSRYIEAQVRTLRRNGVILAH